MKIFILTYNTTTKYFIDYINSLKQIYNNIELYEMKYKNEELYLYQTKNKNNNFHHYYLIDFINNNFDRNNIFIFIQTLPDILLHQEQWHSFFYVLNTEQNTRNNIFLQYIIDLPNEIQIIDYSKENIKYLNDNNIIKSIIYIPYQVNSNEILNFNKTYNIAMIGLKSERRQYIFDEIESQNKINEINGFGTIRDVILMKHKILINVHYGNDYKIFEQFRCNRCILNKMIVITETSDLSEYELKDYLIICDYDEIVEKTIEVINNYEYYYNKLFADFDVEKIKEKYNLSTEKLF